MGCLYEVSVKTAIGCIPEDRFGVPLLSLQGVPIEYLSLLIIALKVNTSGHHCTCKAVV